MKYLVNGTEERLGDELMQIGILTSDYSAGIWKKGKDGQGDYMSNLYYPKSCIIRTKNI